MKFPFLASSIIFVLVIIHAVRRNNRIRDRQNRDFWEREAAADNVRKKPLDNLPYVHIALDELPCGTLAEDETVRDCLETLQALSTRKIACFAGITNTDLKLTYGTANITALTEYDQNFTLLVTTLQKWANALYESGRTAEARRVLEYAVSIQSDNGKSYYLLASIYKNAGEEFRIAELITAATGLSSPSGSTIARVLRESYPHIG